VTDLRHQFSGALSAKAKGAAPEPPLRQLYKWETENLSVLAGETKPVTL